MLVTAPMLPVEENGAGQWCKSLSLSQQHVQGLIRLRAMTAILSGRVVLSRCFFVKFESLDR
jgi:hypothetical protein